MTAMHGVSTIPEMALMGITIAVVLASILLAWYFYLSCKRVPSAEGTKLPVYESFLSQILCR